MCSEDPETIIDDQLLIEDAMIAKVTAIQGHTDLLLERHAKDPLSLKWLSSIMKAAEGLSELVYQIRHLRQKRQQP